MTDWPESRQLAAQYQSPGTTGIGFAQYASSGTVTPELWENILHTESLAQSNKGKPAVEHWTEDMAALRKALTAEGIFWPQETVTFDWSTEKGRCQDCNLPAAYRLTHIALDTGDFLLCSVCAAYHASHGDEIEYLYDEDEENEA